MSAFARPAGGMPLRGRPPVIAKANGNGQPFVDPTRRVNTPAQEPSVGPLLVSLADVEEREVEWLWQGVFALGKVNVVYGDPGLGKSFLTIDASARVSTGTPFPNESCGRREPGRVIIVNAEDDLSDTVKPRLIKAGADCGNVVALQGIRHVNAEGRASERSFTLAAMPILEQAVRETPGVRLVIIDPISAFLGDADSHNNAEVRGLLAPLAKLAADSHVAVVVVTHMNKSSGTSALYRATGSLGLIAAARTGWLVTRDPDNENRRLFLPAKNNLAPDVRGFAYVLHDGAVCWERGSIDMRADEALAAQAAAERDAARDREHESDGKPGPKAVARDAAADWLQDLLAGGPMPVAKIQAEAKAAGLSWTAAVRRARQSLGIRPYKSGVDGGWFWRLPDQGEHVEGEQPVGLPDACSPSTQPAHLRDNAPEMQGLYGANTPSSAGGCSSSEGPLSGNDLRRDDSEGEQDKQDTQGAVAEALAAQEAADAEERAA